MDPILGSLCEGSHYFGTISGGVSFGNSHLGEGSPSFCVTRPFPGGSSHPCAKFATASEPPPAWTKRASANST